MPEPSSLTIVGVDVRALAQSARRAGRHVIGIDGFSDLDTRDACVQSVRAGGCGADALTDAAISTARGDRRPDLIVGGGLDARPDLLCRLSRSFRLRGNAPETAATLSNASEFFGLLDRLDIQYPPICDRLPAKPDTWLLKNTASCGGQGVVQASTAPAADVPAGRYFQQRVAGRVVSVVFAAAGSRAAVIGYSRLFSQAVVGRPYCYAGAIAWAEPNQGLQPVIEGWIEALTPALALRGINGIDLLLPAESSAPLLLEINARPTATLELHQDRLPEGGVQCHLDACNGLLPQPTHLESIQGSRVVYAQSNITVLHRRWPAWCSDRPAFGECIVAGAPLCSVHAAGADSLSVERLLARRVDTILQTIDQPTSQAA